MTDRHDLVSAGTEAVDLAAHLLRTSKPGSITPKGERDMVTALDYAIEQQVRALLRDRTPDVGFLGEEEGASGGASEFTWALDPIDGTANFLHGIPLCGVSLGLIHRGRPVLGIVDLPFLGTRYAAVEGEGAHANGDPIQVSGVKSLSDAIVAIGDYATGEDAKVKNSPRLAITARLAAQAQRVRMHGSAAIDLVWLAHGRIDAVITLSNKPWDMAAGVIIAREAGALIVDRDGSTHTIAATATIGANPPLLPQVLGLIDHAENCHQDAGS